MYNQRLHARASGEQEKELSLLTIGLAGESCWGGREHMVARGKYSFTKAPAPAPLGATWDHSGFDWTRCPSSP